MGEDDRDVMGGGKSNTDRLSPCFALARKKRALLTREWQGHGLRVHHLTHQDESAEELLSRDVHVVVCSYGFLEANLRELERKKAYFGYYRERLRERQFEEPDLAKPTRAVTALFTEVWKITNRPWKHVVLDEAQLVSKRDGVRHRAIKKLPARSFVCLTTTGHIMWHDVSGYADFLKGHPFTTHQQFLHAFSLQYGKMRNPDQRQIRLLQRFLQALLIARPLETMLSQSARN
jgi:SNF2 family DNA or RNA helicase